MMCEFKVCTCGNALPTVHHIDNFLHLTIGVVHCRICDAVVSFECRAFEHGDFIKAAVVKWNQLITEREDHLSEEEHF